MPYLKKDNLSLHYTDHGEGEAIITLHGLSESGLYWTLPGITDQLVAAWTATEPGDQEMSVTAREALSLLARLAGEAK